MAATVGSKFIALQKPLQLGSLTLANRIAMASMTRNRAKNDNIPDATIAEHYKQRASAGLILTECALVSPQGAEWSHAPGLWNDAQTAGWRQVTEMVHAAGSKIFAQLNHVGRVAHPALQGGRPALGPSAIAAKGGKFRQLEGEPGYVVPEAISDPRALVAEFKAAAARAKAAGFDGVELHAANGYLASQFLESHSNRRTDAYGGSVAKRSRFVLEAMDEMAGVWGDAKRVGIKLSPSGGYNDMGEGLPGAVELYSHLCKELDGRKIGYVQLSRYGAAFDYEGRGTNVDIYQFRPLLKNTLMFANGDYSPEEAEEAVASGKADAVVIGRPYISNPDYATRIFNGKPLNMQIDFGTLYGPPEGQPTSVGYNDYPAAA